MSTNQDELLLLEGHPSGAALIPARTPLSRLNYFDGKFLKAADLAFEQRYLMQLVALSNQGLGSGVVYGFDTALAGGGSDEVSIGPGLAVDPSGNLLYLPGGAKLSIQQIIDATREAVARAPDASGKRGADAFSDCVEVVAPPPVNALPASDLYVLAICRAEALCGQEDVYGKLCEDACITSSDRPFRTEGIVVRAIPLQLATPLPTSSTVSLSGAHLRSRVASAFFADEVAKHPHAIRRDGLLSTTWCLGAGYDASCCEVPLAVIARSGASTLFLDAWTVRRERIDAPAKRYWQWKMRMRPWDVFLAQVLQFQCQLAGLLDRPEPPKEDDCHAAVKLAAELLERLRGEGERAGAAGMAALGLGFTHLENVRNELRAVLEGRVGAPAQGRVLVRRGMVELPSAGYLPVLLPSATALSVNEQVRALLGEGLDYRFCVVRPDYVAEALQEAQHMERISLLEGLDDPGQRQAVDILVPDGVVRHTDVTPDGFVYEAAFTGREGSQREPRVVARLRGAAREIIRPEGGFALYSGQLGRTDGIFEDLLAELRGGSKYTVPPLDHVEEVTGPSGALGSAAPHAAPMPLPAVDDRITVKPQPELESDGGWLEALVDRDLRHAHRGDTARFEGRVVASHPVEDNRGETVAFEVRLSGTLMVDEVSQTASGLVVTGSCQPSVQMLVGLVGPDGQQRGTTRHDASRLKVRLTLSKDGTAVLDVFDVSGKEKRERPMVRLERTGGGAGAPVTYRAYATDDDDATGQTVFTPVIDLRLSPNPEAAQPVHPARMRAEGGLDLVQATRLATDPQFKSVQLAKLFPGYRPGLRELVLDARHDWVLFTRRRERLCSEVIERPLALPPQRYLVRPVAVDERALKVLLDRLRHGEDPGVLGKELDKKVQRRAIYVEFAGGTAERKYQPQELAEAWAQTNVDGVVKAVVVSAKQGTSEALETNRARQVASDAHAELDRDVFWRVLRALPEGADSAGVDGVMVFFAVERASQRLSLLVPVQDFNTAENAFEPSQWSRGSASFTDDKLEDDSQLDKVLPVPELRVFRVVVASPGAGRPLTDGAAARRDDVRRALQASNRLIERAPSDPRPLHAMEAKWLEELGEKPEDYDDVIFLQVGYDLR